MDVLAAVFGVLPLAPVALPLAEVATVVGVGDFPAEATVLSKAAVVLATAVLGMAGSFSDYVWTIVSKHRASCKSS